MIHRRSIFMSVAALKFFNLANKGNYNQVINLIVQTELHHNNNSTCECLEETIFADFFIISSVSWI